MTGTNTIAFGLTESNITLDLADAGNGNAGIAPPVQQVAADLWLALIGQFPNVIATAGNDSIVGGSGPNVLTGGAGNDTLVGGSGPATLIAGSGNDSLVAGSGGTSFEFSGTTLGNDTVDLPGGAGNTLDFSKLGGPVTLDLASTSKQTVNSTTGLTLTLDSNAAKRIDTVIDSAFADNITGNAAGDHFYVGAGNDTFTGGGGGDTFFSGNKLGNDLINEGGTFNGVAASFTNSLNFLGAPPRHPWRSGPGLRPRRAGLTPHHRPCPRGRSGQAPRTIRRTPRNGSPCGARHAGRFVAATIMTHRVGSRVQVECLSCDHLSHRAVPLR